MNMHLIPFHLLKQLSPIVLIESHMTLPFSGCVCLVNLLSGGRVVLGSRKNVVNTAGKYFRNIYYFKRVSPVFSGE